MKEPTGPPRRFRRGVALLPVAFTIANLCMGFWALVRTLHGQFGKAAPLILLAGVFDMLDGRIARLTGTTSEFGGELDSLADVISFGIAPALLAYCWGFPNVHKAGWVVAFLFVASGAMRLARFNIQRHAVDGRYFVGMPIPAAAGQIATIVWFEPEMPYELLASLLMMALVLALSLLMVSTFRYPSFKGIDLRTRRSYVIVLPIALAIAVLVLHPQSVLLALSTLYSLWAPGVYLIGLAFRRRTPPPRPAAAAAL